VTEASRPGSHSGADLRHYSRRKLMSMTRAFTAIISASALALITAPYAGAAGATPLSAASATHWYQGKTGTIKWAIGDEFLQQLTDAGATMSFCSAAKLAVVSGVNVATMPAHGNSIIRLGGGGNTFDGVTDCAVTISGNGTEIVLSKLYFSVSGTYPSDMSADINEAFTALGVGASTKLPKVATRNRIAVISPALVTKSEFTDLLRSGPAPSMTSEAVNLGLFQLGLKVKATSQPQDPHNEE
jgi:hypothetical protein